MTIQSTKFKLLAGIIGLVQLFDALIHIATGQVEFMRIAANILIIFWLISLWQGWLGRQLRTGSAFIVALYLILNIVFLVQNGLTNPEQGDAPRTLLFLLVSTTVLLSGWVTLYTSN